MDMRRQPEYDIQGLRAQHASVDGVSVETMMMPRLNTAHLICTHVARWYEGPA